MSEKRRKRHSPDQIISKLRDADAWLNAGESIAQVLQKLQVSEATYHRWRAQFGGMKSDAMKRLKELEEENRKLKRAVADLTLDKVMLKDVIEGIQSESSEPDQATYVREASAGCPCRVAASGVQGDESTSLDPAVRRTPARSGKNAGEADARAGAKASTVRVSPDRGVAASRGAACESQAYVAFVEA